MIRRLATSAALAAVFASGVAVAPAATAGNVAWSVSVGGPGFAVAAGNPGYAHGRYGFGYGPVARPYYGSYYAAPVVAYPAPVVYPVPVVYPAPVVYRPSVVYRVSGHAPRRANVGAPVLPPPRMAIPYGSY